MGTYEGYDVVVELENEIIRFHNKVCEIVNRLKEKEL